MRVVDLRLKDKGKDVIEGVISSMKTIELDEEKHVGVVLDTGYLVQISLEELDSIVDYAEESEGSSEETQQEDKEAEEVKADKKIDAPQDFSLGGCSICGSPMVWFSKDLGIKQCSNGKCKNAQVSAPNFDS